MLVNEVPEYNDDLRIITLTPSESVGVAVDLLAQYNIGVLPIVDKNKVVIGVFSERDVVVKVLGNDLRPRDTLLSDVMTKNPDTVLPEDNVFDCILAGLKGGYRRLIITDDQNKLITILTQRDLMAVLWSEIGNIGIDNNHKLEDIVKQKASDSVISLSSGWMVYEAIKLMAQRNFGAIPVIDEGMLVGIITERDITKKVIAKQRDYKTTAIWQVMTSTPDTVTYDTPLKILADNAVFKLYRHFLIVDKPTDTNIKSILSLRDLIKFSYQILMDKGVA